MSSCTCGFYFLRSETVSFDQLEQGTRFEPRYSQLLEANESNQTQWEFKIAGSK